MTSPSRTQPGNPSLDSTQRLTIDQLSLQTADAGSSGPGGANAMMYAWFQLFKTAQIHALDNKALHRPIQTMVEMSASLVSREGRISFQAKDRSLFVNGVKLKLSSDEYELAGDVFEFFEQRGMGGFIIEGALDEAAVRTLLQIFVYSGTDRRFERIDAALKESGVPFRINKPLGGGKKSDAEVVLERRGYTFFTYSKLVVLYRSLLAEQHLNASRRMFFTKKIARTVQALVDVCLEDDHTFLGVSSVKSGDAYEPHHAANVAVLSIAIGEKIGMSKVDLADLGMAAVFHDIGLRSCPAELIEKQGSLSEREKAVIDQHTLRSVEFLLEEKKFNRSALARIVVAFEHHRPFASAQPGHRAPDLFSRIVSIAAVFDALTTTRPWRKAYLPDEALAMMLADSGKTFDPALLKIFVNSIGLYPVGTLVKLDTGELAVVVFGGGEGERLNRPVVALVGRDGTVGATIDLLDRNPAGHFSRSITGTDDPARYGLQTSGLVAVSPAAR